MRSNVVLEVLSGDKGIIPHSGAYVAHFSVPVLSGGKSFLTKKVTPNTNLYLKAYFNLNPKFSSNSTAFIDFIQLNDSKYNVMEKLRIQKYKDKFQLISQLGGTLPALLDTNTWHCLEISFVQSTSNTITFSLNGIVQTNSTTSTTTNLVAYVDIGALRVDSLNTGAEMLLDDVTLSSSLPESKKLMATATESTTTPQILIIHPDFLGRIGTRVLVILTGTKSGDRLIATLEQPDKTKEQLANQPVPINWKRCNFDLSLKGKPAGLYTFTTSLCDSNGSLLASSVEEISKPYNEDPRFTLDANNIFYLDGKKIIPVTSFGLQETRLNTWVTNNCINVAYGQGWYLPSPTSMRSYIKTAKASGIPTIGPLNMGVPGNKGATNGQTDEIVQYFVSNMLNNTNLIAYSLKDEPEYHGFTSADHKAWWDIVKKLDPSKLTHVNLMGTDFLTNNDANVALGKSFTYPYLTADIYGFDYYPLWGKNKPFSAMYSAARNLSDWNFGLVPLWGFVQTANVELANVNSRTPTPDELNLMAWLLIIGGGRGVQWYHYEGITPPENMLAMGKFTKDISALTEVIYSTNTTPNMEITTPSDTFSLCRLYENTKYFFLANATTNIVSVSINPNTVYRVKNMSVYGTKEILTSKNGVFTTQLPPLAVKIFMAIDPIIPANTLVVPQ